MARRQYIFTEETHRGRGFLLGVLVTLLLLAAGLFTANLALTHTVTYTREYVTISNLPSGLDNFTILHLSDLNGAELGDHQSAIKKAIGQRTGYGAVVLSGNMVGQSGDVQPLLDLIGQLPHGAPVLLLPGDGDPALYEGSADSPYAPWARQLVDAGVTILDEPIPIVSGKATIWFTPESLYTMDTVSTEKAWQNQLDILAAQVEPLTPEQEALQRSAAYQVARMQRIRDTIDQIKEKDIQVVVSHMPLTLQSLAESRAWATSKVFTMSRVSLALSGGYCAGQWRIPGVGAVYVPELGFFPDDGEVTGLGYLAGVWQHISPGLGASTEYPWFMPFRLFNSPGATMLVLTVNNY